MKLPEGCLFHDKEGTARSKVRVRWWDIPVRARISQLAMPDPFDAPGDADGDELRRMPDYGAHEPPVFFGHYWMPAGREKAPLRHNIACLDFSATREGPMVAYRWDVERRLDAVKFVVGDLN